MKQRMVFLTIVIFAVTLTMPALGAEQQQAPAAKPGMQQAPAGTTQMIPTVQGHVKRGGQGVAGIEVKLIKIGQTEQKTATTSGTGGYHFTLTSEDIGAGYRIIPKHRDFPLGHGFTPHQQEFTLADGITTMDFSFKPPAPDLIVGSIYRNSTSDGSGNFRLEIVVRNNGTAPAGPFKIRVEKQAHACTSQTSCYDDQWTAVSPDHSVAGLNLGAVHNYILPGVYLLHPGGNPYSGWNFRVSADSGHEVAEIIEDNNVGSLMHNQ